MPILVALREIYYARRTYEAGSLFEAPEKDAKVLKAIGRAVDVDVPVVENVPAIEESAPVPESLPGHYQRRDMRAEDGRIGRKTSSQSSRRGRPPKARTSDA